MRRVAVTGYGVVSPIGTGREAFFSGLREARSGIGTIRAFDASSFPTRLAGEVTDLDRSAVDLDFEHGAALARDPKSLYGLVAAREALGHAFGSQRPFTDLQPDRVAAFIASGLEIFHMHDAVAHVQSGQLDAGGLLPELMAAPAGAHLQIPAHLAARRIADEAGADGIRGVNVSACAAGTQALGDACLAIVDGRAEAAITGGYDSMVNPLGVGGFCMLEAMTRANDLGPAASRPFDASRDGFVLGEGAAMLVLEELERARARGATIHAEVLGYATTLDAFRVSDPAEDQAMPTACMRAALADAGLSPGRVGYVNAHGTGTRKNDPAEAAAIRSAFGQAAETIPVSSTKSQIGHLIGAAGAVEFIAGLFALAEQSLPATLNLQQVDPACELVHVPGVPRPAPVEIFLSNSFGFGGQNASILAGRVEA